MKEKLNKIREELIIYAKVDDEIIALIKGFTYRGEKKKMRTHQPIKPLPSSTRY